MAQLRRAYSELRRAGTEVVVVGPEDAAAFAAFWQEHDLPFVGLPDPEFRVLKLYGQEIKLFRFGRMPAQALIDAAGIVRFVHYGHSMADIPSTSAILELLASFAQAPEGEPKGSRDPET